MHKLYSRKVVPEKLWRQRGYAARRNGVGFRREHTLKAIKISGGFGFRIRFRTKLFEHVARVEYMQMYCVCETLNVARSYSLC